jgi:hypothetical protein
MSGVRAEVVLCVRGSIRFHGKLRNLRFIAYRKNCMMIAAVHVSLPALVLGFPGMKGKYTIPDLPKWFICC